MPTRAILVSLLLVLASGRVASAQSVEVIVHPDSKISSITKAELSKIFLKRLHTWETGEDARPVDQVPEARVRREFSELVHDRSVVTIEVYWKRMIFSGRGVPPEELNNDEAVLEFVRTTPGAVGYVASSANLTGVQKLALRE
jgi:ABC-type phosphate transport system substrate-binding protein